MSYMKLKQFALVISLVVFGTQCANVMAEVPCMTHEKFSEEFKKRSLSEDQREDLAAHIRRLFNDRSNNIGWQCLAGGISEVITNHNIPELNTLAADLKTASTHKTVDAIGTDLQKHASIFFPSTTYLLLHLNEILAELKLNLEERLKIPCTDESKKALIAELYVLLHPEIVLCGKMPITQEKKSTSAANSDFMTQLDKERAEMERQAAELLSDDD